MNENNYAECYIAVMDILGFKRMVYDKSFQEILNLFQEFRIHVKKIYFGNEENVACQVETAEKVKLKVMSDTICFYIEADLPDALFCLMLCCAFFQARLLSRPSPILIRGGITAGKLYVDGDKVFGPGFVEAYLLEEKNAKDPRIIIRKNTLEQGLHTTNHHLLKAWSSIALEDFDAFYRINFNIFLGDSVEDKIAISKWLRDAVNQKLSEEIDESIRHKYLYLKKHIECYPQEEDVNA